MANGLEFAMAIPLRTDFDANTVRAAARKSKDGAQARRLLALAAIYEGSSRTEAARIGGVTLQIVRDWVVKFNAAGPDGLIDRKAPGKPSLLNATHRAALVEAIERGQLAIEPGVRLLRRDRRSLLSRLEQTRRTALEDHVYRPARLGICVLITEFLVLFLLRFLRTCPNADGSWRHSLHCHKMCLLYATAKRRGQKV